LYKINYPKPIEIRRCINNYLIREVSPSDRKLLDFIKSSTRFWIFYRLKSLAFKIFFGSFKTVSRVNSSYTQVWSTNQFPGHKDIKSKNYLLWGDEILEVRDWGEKRVHLLILSRIIASTRIKTYLEVGCGNGAMLMMLSTMHPDVHFVGIELTEQGVVSAKKIQSLRNLPAGMMEFIPETIKDASAFKRVTFMQGNAATLPFEKNKFDLVSTTLALEQMKAIQKRVLKEISRVSKNYVSLLEPFPDFNQTKLRKAYTKGRDYFSIPTTKLNFFGLRILSVFDDFPSKIYRGAALVLAKKMKI